MKTFKLTNLCLIAIKISIINIAMQIQNKFDLVKVIPNSFCGSSLLLSNTKKLSPQFPKCFEELLFLPKITLFLTNSLPKLNYPAPMTSAITV